MTVRRTLSCVLMMTLLLASCAAGGESPEDLAAEIRSEYLDMSGWSARTAISVDYGETVFDFTVDARWSRAGETVLTVVEPELLAGITARIAQGETVLEYDGAGLSLGLLDGDGLTPVSAVTALMEAAMSGYMARCAWDGDNNEYLTVLCRDPEVPEGTGTEYLLSFDAASHALTGAEVSVDGAVVLTAQLSDFTLEMTENDAQNQSDLG